MTDCHHDNAMRYCDLQRIAEMGSVTQVLLSEPPILHRAYACSACGRCYVCHDHPECPTAAEDCHKRGCP